MTPTPKVVQIVVVHAESHLYLYSNGLVLDHNPVYGNWAKVPPPPAHFISPATETDVLT